MAVPSRTGWAAAGNGKKAKSTYAGIIVDAFGRVGAAVLNASLATSAATFAGAGFYPSFIENTFGEFWFELIVIMSVRGAWAAGDVMSGSVGGGDEHAEVLQDLLGPQWWTGGGQRRKKNWTDAGWEPNGTEEEEARGILDFFAGPAHTSGLTNGKKWTGG